MKILRLLAFAAIAAAAVHSSAFADTVTVQQYPTALPPNGNFQNPTIYGSVAYTITTSDDGTNFDVILTTANLHALQFANLYFDTDASTPGTGSNLGFEFGPGSEDAFAPGVPGTISLDGTGVTSVFTQNANGTTATITIPNSFLLNNPIATVQDGGLVSIHLSQSFGYEVAGGSAFGPNELGAAYVGSNSPVPEPATIEYMLLSGLGVLGVSGRRLFSRLRS